MKLIRYRDQHMLDAIWFWINTSEEPVSPNFYSQEEAEVWLQEQIDPWDNWKPCKDIG